MDEATTARLVGINRTFYARFFDAFDETRTGPWPGWNRVLAPPLPPRVLDLGCGNGRFARHLEDVAAAGPPGPIITYEGWDACAPLLARARARQPGRRVACRFAAVDVQGRAWPSAVAELVVAFGLLHHIPGFEGRRRLLDRALTRVAPGGRLAVCFWQLAPGGAPRVRTAPWSAVGLEASAVGPADHQVQWRRGGVGLRYCHHASPEEVDRLVAGLPAAETDRFVSDGASGDLNLYVILRKG